MAIITLLDYGEIKYEDNNSIFIIKAFDASIAKHYYTDEETQNSEGDVRKLVYQDEITRLIGSMQPKISRRTAEYVIVSWEIKDTAQDHIIIPGCIESDNELSYKTISAITPSALTSWSRDNAMNVKHIEVKEGIRFLPRMFFSIYFENLQSVSLPSSMESIGYNCFLGLEQLVDIDIPEHVEIINDGTFGLCDNLESVQLPESLLAIAGGAFLGTALKAVVIPEQTEIIAQKAFAYCKSLKQVVLPYSLFYIADDAFEGCPEDVCFLVPRCSYAGQWTEEHGLYYKFID